MKTSIALIALIALLAIAGCGGVRVDTVPQQVSAPSAPSAPPPAPSPTPASPPAAKRVAYIVHDAVGGHDEPAWVAQHVELIESRPFDGMVVNSYWGRNLMRPDVAAEPFPGALQDDGAVSVAAIESELLPLRGVFQRFTANFIETHFNLNAQAPLLNDDLGWSRACESAKNLAYVTREIGMRGIFLDDENYIFTVVDGRATNYWDYSDQILLQGTSTPFTEELSLARQRGYELMGCLQAGYPGITVIVTHSPASGTSRWLALTGYSGDDHFMIGAFAAGMVDATTGAATFVDGDPEFGPADDFSLYHDWRKGLSSPNITTPGVAPFMDDLLASKWSSTVSVGFGSYDKSRPSMNSNDWTPTTDVAAFEARLRKAYSSSDAYCWHYSQWQDWFGSSTEAELKPWMAAIQAVRGQ